MPCVCGIDGSKALKRPASRYQLVSGLGATSHASIPHGQHAKAVSDAVPAGLDAMTSGILHSFELRRMHRFDTNLGESLRRCNRRARRPANGVGEARASPALPKAVGGAAGAVI